VDMILDAIYDYSCFFLNAALTLLLRNTNSLVLPYDSVGTLEYTSRAILQQRLNDSQKLLF
jgi:hypothetical protein